MSGMLNSLLFLFIFYFYLLIYVSLLLFLLFFMCLDFHRAHEGCHRSVYITCSVIVKWQTVKRTGNHYIQK